MKTARTLRKSAKSLESDQQEVVFGAILAALAPIQPVRAAAIGERVLARVREDVAAGRAVSAVAADAGEWLELMPLVRGKRVFTDGTAESWMFRLAPGARAPAHIHPGREECVVLEGSIRYVGGSTLKAGDYEVMQPGMHHAELVSDTGALLFLRYALPLNRYIRQ